MMWPLHEVFSFERKSNTSFSHRLYRSELRTSYPPPIGKHIWQMLFSAGAFPNGSIKRFILQQEFCRPWFGGIIIFRLSFSTRMIACSQCLENGIAVACPVFTHKLLPHLYNHFHPRRCWTSPHLIVVRTLCTIRLEEDRMALLKRFPGRVVVVHVDRCLVRFVTR